MRRTLAIALLLVAVPRIASAGDWYYRWSCAGDCAPNELAISGQEGPFASRSDCDDARDHDWRAEYFIEPGNLGGLEFCEERVDTSTDSSSGSYSGGGGDATPHRKIPMARFMISAIAGPSYRVEDGGVLTGTGQTGGFEIGVQSGGRPELGFEMSVGLHYSRVTAPYYGPDAKPMVFVPLMLGLASSPALSRGKHELRLDLAADAGALFRAGCSDCGDMMATLSFVGELRAGLDTYFGGDGGFGLDAVFLFGRQRSADVAIAPPAFLLRFSMIVRNRDGVAW